ncbi:hypothetical protein ABIB56_000060 [Glaciihabitans sp. UYNi722]
MMRISEVDPASIGPLNARKEPLVNFVIPAAGIPTDAGNAAL